MIDRRWFIAASLASMSGCASRSLEECDPHGGGTFDYFACRDQYPQRYQQDLDRLQAAQSRYRAEDERRRALELEVAGLESELAENTARVDELRVKHAELKRRLGEWQRSNSETRRYLIELSSYLRGLDSAYARIINYSFPNNTPNKIVKRLEGRLLSLQYAASEKKTALEKAIRVVGEWVKFGISYEGEEYIKEHVVFKILRDFALDEVNPIIGFGLMLHDIYEFAETVKKSGEILND